MKKLRNKSLVKFMGIVVYSGMCEPSARTFCTSLTEDENHPHGDCTTDVYQWIKIN